MKNLKIYIKLRNKTKDDYLSFLVIQSLFTQMGIKPVKPIGELDKEGYLKCMFTVKV